MGSEQYTKTLRNTVLVKVLFKVQHCTYYTIVESTELLAVNRGENSAVSSSVLWIKKLCSIGSTVLWAATGYQMHRWYLTKYYTGRCTTLDTGHYTLYTLHYTLYTINFTLCTIHYTLYTIHYTLNTVHYTLYTIYYTLHTLHYTLCSIDYRLYTKHYTLYILST